MSDSAFEELVGIMARLRAPDGCPWDREQTIHDLARYIREEAEEVTEAIAGGDPDEIRDELGDLLFNIIHAAKIGEERGEFTIQDVIEGARDKIVRRHPHVFGDAVARTTEEVLEHWNRIKRAEKEDREP
ncbi:MAG: MazG nucleotide pyrophosphohydrolase domain-containing protein [Planctomycetota bacterium]|jgi:MazG family protein